MAAFTDNLDGSAGAVLSTRSGWAIAFGTTANESPICTSGSGFCFAPGGGGTGTLFRPTSQPATANQYVQALLRRDVQSFPIAVRVTINAGATNFGGYFARYNSPNIELYRRSTSALVATGYTLLGSVAASNTLAFKLVANGNSIWIEQGGTILIGPVTDTNFPTGSVAALNRAATTAYAAPAALDDWVSDDVAVNRVFAFSTGAFAVAGSAASITAQRRLSAAPGVFAVTGAAASLKAARVLSVETGAFAVDGKAASLTVARRLIFATGACIVEGAAAALLAARRLAAEGAVYALAGAAATLRVDRRLTFETGAFVVTGSPAALVRSGHVGLPPASRQIVVARQNRAVVVDRQDRSVRVARQSRTIVVGA